MTNYDYDYFVIGGGSGGVRSARIAAGHGAKVGLAEGRHYGGTCVNIGCVPKKLFAYASDYGPAFEDSKGFGWEIEKPTFNWQKLIKNKNNEINRLNGIYKNLLKNAGVITYDGMAGFKDQHTLIIDNQEITAEKILIATGGKPRPPSYEGAEHSIVSDDAFYLEQLPKHVVIEGAGYIAVEFAHIFHGLGSEVTIIYRGDHILRGFDDDIRDFLALEMQKQGINITLNTNITKINDKNGQKTVHTDKNEQISCDLVFSAIGRVPNIDKLAPEKAGIKFKENGQIIINDNYQTNLPHIYAVGDVTDHIQLTPVALAEGHVLADRLFNKRLDRMVSYENIPTAVFSSPPIGTVGLTQQQAMDKGHEIEIYKSTFKPMRHTLSDRDEKTLMKLVIDKKTDKVLGAHMCGADAPEIMQGIGIALQCGATKADFDRTIGIHPTAAEEFVTMRSPAK
ncbi:MAG TPA: glutathione-disulfide reductase [Alphaproteobacteria bacterium]|nr:glutathione-disulfide reductase [Alphaproteobacteria bacterium]